MTRELALAALLMCSIGLVAQTVVPSGGPVGAQSPAQAAAKPGTAIITGRILAGDDGTPIEAATVALSGGSLPRFDAYRVLTDAQGRFFYSELPAGTYELAVTKPGWLPGAFGRSRPGGASTSLVITDNLRLSDLDVRLWRYAVITGRVVDSSGEPLVSADVRAFRVSYTGGRAAPVFVTRVRTDDRGIYRFSALDPGDYLICVPAAVTSEPSGMSGVVRAQGEQPRPYLQTMSAVGSVAMTLDRADGASGSDRWGISSALAIPSSPPASGAWLTYPTTFAPSAQSPAAATLVRAMSGRERAGVDVIVRLLPTFRVSGILTGPEGPAAYYAVHLLQAESADAPLVDTSTAITDSAGAFMFFGVPAGSYVARVVRTPWPGANMRLGIGSAGGDSIRYVMTFSAGPGAPGPPSVPADPLFHATRPVVVADRDVRDVAMTLQAGPRVTGRLQFDGTAAQPSGDALQRLQVTLEPADGQVFRNVMPGVATATGQFATPSMWPGRYLVRVSNPPQGWTLKSTMVQDRDASERAIDLTSDLDGVVLLFTDKPTTLSGNVEVDARAAATGAPVVILFPVERTGWVDYGRTSRRVRAASVSKAGMFTMPAPPEGEYCLVAIPDSSAMDWQNPAFLERLAGLADRIQVRDGQSLSHTLQLKRVP